MTEQRYCKRLIEVDLPIKKISANAKDEKNLRSGHPWHLHVWWARRPWGACRAVALASLLPDPVDVNCPESFIDLAPKVLSPLGYGTKTSSRENLRSALLRFVGDISQWELGAKEPFRSAERRLIEIYYGKIKPVLFDSFSGNGAIPAEAARLGCESIAIDLNPVANLILHTLLEACPKHGSSMLDKFQEGAEFIRKETKSRLLQYYPEKNGKDPIAWLWARTVTCEGPGCGACIPLISQTVIAKDRNKTWIEIEGNKKKKTVAIKIVTGKTLPKELFKTAGGGSAFCPVCGFTTPKASVKRQGKDGRMGNYLYGIAIPIGVRQGKEYLNATEQDGKVFDVAEFKWRELMSKGEVTELTEPFVLTYGLHVPPHYGISRWGHLFSTRQKITFYTIKEILDEYALFLRKDHDISEELVRDVITALALAVSNAIPFNTTLSGWIKEGMQSCNSMLAILMRWDWAEANPLVPQYVGGLDFAFKQAAEAIKAAINVGNSVSNVLQADATTIPLPDDLADMFFTDPPYYDVVPYGDLSDLNYVWLKRFLGKYYSDLFEHNLTPKKEQIVVNPYSPDDGRGKQTPELYRENITKAFSEGRRILKPNGIGAIIFAHKGTEAWETLLRAIIDGGFLVTASWPIDTERAARMRAKGSATLASSVHIIVRPRENASGMVETNKIGDWRDVLQELPRKIHEWMPRLTSEGVVGADAIFACLGPALEIFSRYSHVEKANGEKVHLKEYLEQVWGAVAKEALNMIFQGAHTEGFEEDARLTAMWLWTLSTGSNDIANVDVESTDDTDENSAGNIKGTGFSLEFDAARKIAQGLGVHLENLSTVIEIDGDQARLLPVSERVNFLFGKGSTAATSGRKKKKENQMTLFEEFNKVEEQGWSLGDEKSSVGKTILDRLHQAMILFGAGRADAMRRFLVEEGVGKDDRFWRLAQAFSALYPSHTDEKRWVDGVLARKKGLGF